MNELIEAGDPRAKVVGKRRPPAPGIESLKVASGLNKLAPQLRKKALHIPRGVVYFKTQKQADQWWINQMTN